MSSSLIESLQGIEDSRAARRKRYPLWLMLLLVVLGTTSECYGYQALEDFCVRDYKALCEHLGLKIKRLPSDSTFRRLFEQLDFQKLTEWFEQWTKQDLNITQGEWLAVDCKSLKAKRATGQSVLPKFCEFGIDTQSQTRRRSCHAAI